MYTDMHSHVIWGVDDGAEREDEMFQMLRDAVADGIDRIICTPHVTPGVYEFPETVFQKHFEDALAYIQREGLKLLLEQGAEILYTENTPRFLRERRVRSLAGSAYALIEFSPTDSKDHIFQAIQRVSGTGFIPVIAHMERYPAIGKIEQVHELRERFRALVQINARTLTRKQPLFRRKYFDRLFTEGLVDFVATDTHSMPGRETCMTEGMKALQEKYGESAAKRIQSRPAILFE